MNSHEQYAALLDAFIDEALPETESERVRAHLAVCPECQAYVSDALTMRELFPGVEETLVPDGFAETVSSRLPPQNVLWRIQAQNLPWRTQWRKIALPLAACLTLFLLIGGVLRSLPTRKGAMENATFTAAGDGVNIMESKAVTYDTDMEETAPENESDMGEIVPESAEEYGGVIGMTSAENASADMDMDGGAMPGGVTNGGAAFGNGMDGGAMPGGVTNGGAALKRTYETPEESETEESAIFDMGITAPTFYHDSADLPETRLFGAFDDALTDSADAIPAQTAQGDTMPPQSAQSDTTPPQSAESDMIPAYSAQGGAVSAQAAQGDTAPSRNADTESAPDNGDAAPTVTESASIPEPDENQRVSGAKSAASSSDDSPRKAAPDDVSMQSALDNVSTESASESVSAEESVAVSFRTLSPDAASALEQYPVSKKTASGAWYALEPEQFDALRENLPESAFTPMDADSLPPDDAPPLTSPDCVYLFLPFADSANP